MSNQQTIVVVDDDRAYLMMMHEILTDAGYHRVICVHPECGEEVFAAVYPTLVIYGMHFKQSSIGLQLLRQFRGHPKSANIPLIICSTNIVFAQQRLAELGATYDLLLAKPFSIDALFEAVQNCIGPPAFTTTAYPLMERYA